MKKGFTVIEIIAYVAVLGIIGTSFSAVLLWSMKTYTKSQIMQETAWNAQRAMDIMVQEIRESKRVYTPTALTSQLSLATAKYAPTGHMESFIDFFVCQEKLCLKKESQDPVALTLDNVRVTSLSFLRVQSSPATESVRITLQVEYKNPNNRPELISSVELSSAASVRKP
ncbi:MAG: type II secretion system protein [bacterium]|nr:type II secretion system protein [bacterium]